MYCDSVQLCALDRFVKFDTEGESVYLNAIFIIIGCVHTDTFFLVSYQNREHYIITRIPSAHKVYTKFIILRQVFGKGPSSMMLSKYCFTDRSVQLLLLLFSLSARLSDELVSSKQQFLYSIYNENTAKDHRI